MTRSLKRFWHNLPLRVRLTLLYVGLLAFLFSVLGGVLYWDTQRFLIGSTATRLRAQAKPVIERWLYTESPTETPISPSTPRGPVPPVHPADTHRLVEIAPYLARDLTSRDTVAVLLDREGSVIAVGRRLPEEPIPPEPDPAYDARALAGDNEVTYVTTVQEEHALVLLIPLRDAPGGARVLGLVELSTPLGPVEHILTRQKLLLSMLGLLVLAAGALLGLWTTTTTLRPLTAMIATCRRIASGDLSQRLNLPDRRDEIGQLAQSFNDMVAQIEASFAAQRRFVANAAHELRTPLTALRGSLEVLLRGAQDDPAAVSRLNQGMYREVTRLSRLCEQLLDLTRLESPLSVRRQPIQLDTFFDALLPQAQRLAQGNTVILEKGTPVTFQADPDMLTQILFNLIANSVQHNEGDVVITLGWGVDDDRVRLRVADNGKGISPEDLPHIFEPFYRGDRSRSRRQGGTGLGLALTRAMVEAHGGHIDVRSRVGEGTTFTITLPR